MGNVIRQTAAVADILRDLFLTLDRARRDPSLQADAERFVRPSYREGTNAGTEAAAKRQEVDRLRDDQMTANAACDNTVARVRDELYNLIGRPGAGSDPLWAQLFPTGIAGYTHETPTDKPEALALLASRLQGLHHPKIPQAVADADATLLRAKADDLETVNELLSLAQREQRVAERTQTSSARTGQTQLARLKKYWKGLGLSEVDVHTIIPDRPDGRASATVAAAADANPVPAPVPEASTPEPTVAPAAQAEEAMAAK